MSFRWHGLCCERRRNDTARGLCDPHSRYSKGRAGTSFAGTDFAQSDASNAGVVFLRWEATNKASACVSHLSNESGRPHRTGVVFWLYVTKSDTFVYYRSNDNGRYKIRLTHVFYIQYTLLVYCIGGAPSFLSKERTARVSVVWYELEVEASIVEGVTISMVWLEIWRAVCDLAVHFDVECMTTDSIPADRIPAGL